MSEYAVFPVAVAKEMLRVYRQLQASGLLGRDTIESIVRRVPRSIETPVFFRNDSGEEVPRYACMQVIGTVESGGQNYLLIDKPADTDACSGEYIFNGHEVVPAPSGSDAQYGTAQSGRLARAIKASGTSTAGERWNPVVGDWTIEQADRGRFVMAGDDDIATDVARVFITDGCGCPDCGSTSGSGSGSTSGSGSGSTSGSGSGSGSGSSGSSSGSVYEPPFSDCECSAAPGTPGEFNGQTFLNECRRAIDGLTPCPGGYCLSTWTEPDPIGNPGVGNWVLTTDQCSA